MSGFIQMTFDDMFLQKEEKYVRRIQYEETKPFLLGIHYARRMPCITDAFGLFVDGKLVGVVTYGIPASNSLCIGVCGKEYKDHVRELNRLCILPEYNGKNYASYLVGHSLKMLDSGTIVVSYADTGWGHNGYIYQATNFIYTGATKERTDIASVSGHSRHYNKGETNRQLRTSKHRYVFFCGGKTKKKQMLRMLKYKTFPYPKGDDVKYDVNDPKPVVPIKIVQKKESDEP